MALTVTPFLRERGSRFRPHVAGMTANSRHLIGGADAPGSRSGAMALTVTHFLRERGSRFRPQPERAVAGTTTTLATSLVAPMSPAPDPARWR